MKNGFALFCFISTLSLVACNNNGPTKVEYSEFYQKIQEIEENHHSHATMNITYFEDLSGKGETIKATLNYSWSDEQNKFVPDEEYEYDLTDEINRTIKDEFKRAEESEDSKSLGYQYFINPFKGKSIECLCLSKDSRFIFCWSDSNEIAVISNNFAK